MAAIDRDGGTRNCYACWIVLGHRNERRKTVVDHTILQLRFSHFADQRVPHLAQTSRAAHRSPGRLTVGGCRRCHLRPFVVRIRHCGHYEGRHIAFVGMILGTLLACFGWRIFRILALPFLYLWLLVPTGTVFLPLLQRIATLISSSLLKWWGIAVYVDGFFIEVPSGRYHIEEGCAGLNFILAILALAPLYACLLYRSLWKRLLAVVVALVLAITANGVVLQEL